MKLKSKNFTIFNIVVILFLINIPSYGITKRIVDLRTNYEDTPYGVEESPVFSWRMYSKDAYHSFQSAYRILVSGSKKGMERGSYIYDSGKIKSSLSVCIPYKGNKLSACRRYYWKVCVWDEKGKLYVSRPSWFETGLMSSGWSGARWIGSDKALLSKYSSNCVIDYDVRIARNSKSAVFVLGCRDSLDYVFSELVRDKNNKSSFLVGHKESGKEMLDNLVDISDIIPEESFYSTHHIRLTLDSDGSYYYRIYVDVDGKRLSANQKEESFKLYFKNWGQLCRLFAIGFKQPYGENAVFSDIKIHEKAYGTLLYDDPKVYDEKGEGKLFTWYPGADVSAPMLRKTFMLSRSVKRARLYATARGIYEMYLNGKPVSGDFLNPGWTDYRNRIMYNTYDVTSLLKTGSNAIGAILGNGWWSDYCGYNPEWMNQYGVKQSLLAKLVIEYDNGTTSTVVSDGSWLCTDHGPITANSLYNGEDYDARKEMPSWSTSGFDDKEWKRATVYESPSSGVTLQAYIGNPVRVDTVCTACSVNEPQPQTYVYDMGQNMVGVPHLLLRGKPGEEITVKYGEMVYPETIPTDPVSPYTVAMYEKLKGRLYTDNYRSALSTDHYICKGTVGGEVFEPHFTTHGFRYIQITGLSTPPRKEDVKVLVLNSLGSRSGMYVTSDTLINKLYSNIQWGERGNFLSVPTDCPQRDERLGWSGDGQIFSRTATYNRSVDPFYTRWFNTVRDDQGADGNFSDFSPTIGVSPNGGIKGGSCFGWADAGIIIPWEVYQQYGDKVFLERNYESMKHYMRYVEAKAKYGIEPKGGYGDWVALRGTQSDLTNTAYAAYDARLMSKIAGILCKPQDESHYLLFFDRIKKAFNSRFVDKEGYMISPTINSTAKGTKSIDAKRLDSQTAYVMPLQVELFSDSLSSKAAFHLVELIKDNGYCLNTGFIGTPYLNLVLSANGYDDVAYKLFQQTAYPSWLYSVLQGATTLWERWNSYTKKNGFGPVGMNSFNHYAYGAIEDWMMEYSAGIERDDDHPGYKHFILQPRVGGKFTFIRASFDSPYGTIISGWYSDNKVLDDKTNAALYGYTYKASVPANTTASLILPLSKSRNIKVLLGKDGIFRIHKKDPEHMEYELFSGDYIFKINKNLIK